MKNNFTDHYNQILTSLNQYVSEKRKQHILSVAREAEHICLIQGMNTLAEKAVTASLLNDITKEMPLDKHIRIAEDGGCPLTAYDLRFPQILHAFSGAVFAKELFPSIVDDEIYSAIYNHCTGKENMSELDKIVFLADYIEPGRTYDSCKKIRSDFYKNRSNPNALNNAVLASLSETIYLHTQKGKSVHTRTLEARDYLLQKGFIYETNQNT